MSVSAVLLYSGIAVMAASVVAAISSAVSTKGKTKRLNAQLEDEYGRRRP